MNSDFTRELISRMRPGLRRSDGVHCTLPLEIKLRLERLRLIEIIRAERLQPAAQCLPASAGEPVPPTYAMT